MGGIISPKHRCSRCKEKAFKLFKRKGSVYCAACLQEVKELSGEVKKEKRKVAVRGVKEELERMGLVAPEGVGDGLTRV